MRHKEWDTSIYFISYLMWVPLKQSIKRFYNMNRKIGEDQSFNIKAAHAICVDINQLIKTLLKLVCLPEYGKKEIWRFVPSVYYKKEKQLLYSLVYLDLSNSNLFYLYHFINIYLCDFEYFKILINQYKRHTNHSENKKINKFMSFLKCPILPNLSITF